MRRPWRSEVRCSVCGWKPADTRNLVSSTFDLLCEPCLKWKQDALWFRYCGERKPGLLFPSFRLHPWQRAVIHAMQYDHHALVTLPRQIGRTAAQKILGASHVLKTLRRQYHVGGTVTGRLPYNPGPVKWSNGTYFIQAREADRRTAETRRQLRDQGLEPCDLDHSCFHRPADKGRNGTED